MNKIIELPQDLIQWYQDMNSLFYFGHYTNKVKKPEELNKLLWQIQTTIQHVNKVPCFNRLNQKYNNMLYNNLKNFVRPSWQEDFNPTLPKQQLVDPWNIKVNDVRHPTRKWRYCMEEALNVCINQVVEQVVAEITGAEWISDNPSYDIILNREKINVKVGGGIMNKKNNGITIWWWSTIDSPMQIIK